MADEKKPANPEKVVNNGQTAAPAKTKKTTMQVVRENRGLFSIILLLTLIILASIGLAIYYAYDSNRDEAETVSSADSTTEESDSEEENETSEEDTNSTEEESTDGENVAEENTDAEETEGTLNGEGAFTEGEEEMGNSDEEESNNNDEESDESETEENNESEEDTQDVDNGEETNATDVVTSSGISNALQGLSESGKAKSDANKALIASSGNWSATDYEQGDIASFPLTVNEGDTLWEIAEGYYGDGFRWVEILDRNADLIGFLPNGEQALIIPGTQLR